MHAESTMTRAVIAVPPELPLVAAHRLMTERHIRHLPVVQGGRLVGMLSDRDILLRAQPGTWGEASTEVPSGYVGEAMTVDPVTCTVETTVSWLAETMVKRKIDAIPVVAGHRLVGLVTSSDLLELLIDRDEAQILPFDFDLETVSAPAA